MKKTPESREILEKRIKTLARELGGQKRGNQKLKETNKQEAIKNRKILNDLRESTAKYWKAKLELEEAQTVIENKRRHAARMQVSIDELNKHLELKTCVHQIARDKIVRFNNKSFISRIIYILKNI